MSKTPRTDEWLKRIGAPYGWDGFARQLERELNEMVDQRDEAVIGMLTAKDGIIKERNEWKKCAEELAEQLTLHQRYLPQHDTDKTLKRYDKLKDQTK